MCMFIDMFIQYEPVERESLKKVRVGMTEKVISWRRRDGMGYT